VDKIALQLRTKSFGLRAIKLTRALPNDLAARVVGKQFLRSALSVGANYRAACRGRSRADFLSKLGIVLEEVDESAYWLEIITDDEMLPKHKIESLLTETNELTAIFFAATRSTRKLDAVQDGSPRRRRKSSILNHKS
jgi:four helix bundle protein